MYVLMCVPMYVLICVCPKRLADHCLLCRYWLLDGTNLGNAGPRNENPYAHFPYQFQDLLTGYEGTRNCTIAHVSYSYDSVSQRAVAISMARELVSSETTSSHWMGLSGVPALDDHGCHADALYCWPNAPQGV
jgi:hypothetical protein